MSSSRQQQQQQQGGGRREEGGGGRKGDSARRHSAIHEIKLNVICPRLVAACDSVAFVKCDLGKLIRL